MVTVSRTSGEERGEGREAEREVLRILSGNPSPSPYPIDCEREMEEEREAFGDEIILSMRFACKTVKMMVRRKK